MKRKNKQISSNNLEIKTKEKIILTMTSWKKRINHCHKTIEILLTNSLPSYKLILNLETEVFPSKNF